MNTTFYVIYETHTTNLYVIFTDENDILHNEQLMHLKYYKSPYNIPKFKKCKITQINKNKLNITFDNNPEYNDSYIILFKTTEESQLKQFANLYQIK